MRLFSLYSKSIFITSLACFSLGAQSELLSQSTYQNNVESIGACLNTTNYDCLNCSAASSQFGEGCLPSDCSGVIVNCINIQDTVNNPIFSINVNLPSPANGGDTYYLAWNYGDGGATLDFQTTGNFEMGAIFTNDAANTFNFSNVGSINPSTIYLSNSNNYFQSVFAIKENTALQIALGSGNTGDPGNTITGITGIYFYNGELSVPYGGTLNVGLFFNEANVDGDLSGGSLSSTPLILDASWTGLSSTNNVNLSGYINLSLAAAISGSGGTVTVNPDCVLGLNSGANFGSGVTLYVNGGTVQFQTDSISIVNDVIIATGNSYMDVNRLDAFIDAPITGGTSESNLIFINSSGASGTMNLSDGTMGLIGSSVFLGIGSNVTLYTNFTSGATPYIILDEGTLGLETNLTYSSTVFVEAPNSTMRFTSAGTSTIETMTNNGNTASLYVINTETGTQILNINDGSNYDQSLTVGLDTSGGNSPEPVTLNVWQGLFSGGIEIGPLGTVNYYYGANSSEPAPGIANIYSVASAGTFSGSGSFNGAVLNIINTELFGIGVTLEGPISGNLQITISSPVDGSSQTIYTQTHDVTGSIILNSNCSLSMSGGILTLVESQAGIAASQIFGSISGSGNIVIASNTQFGTSSSFPSNSFNSLTFNTVSPAGGGTSSDPAILKIYSKDSLGNGSGTLIANGGELENSGDALTIANPLTLNGLGATIPAITFEGGSLITITGPLTTGANAGTAAMLSSQNTADVLFTPSSLTITNGTPLMTNGNDITVGTLSGTATGSKIILGNGGHSTAINDTLTILGGTYIGSISDNTNGKGAVVITGAVSLLGNNTFSDGLTISSSGNLTINASDNLGSSTINFDGGTLSVPSVGEGLIITADNEFSFNFGTTTTFNIGTGLELDLTGKSSIVGGNSAGLSATGGGVLKFGDTFTFSTGDVYNISVNKSGALLFEATTTTLTAAGSFFNDGVLEGREKSFFALADASLANWKVTNVASDSDPVVNLTIEGILSGTGEATTVEIKSRGYFVPGGVGTGVFTVTDSAIFDDDSVYIIRTN